MTLEIEIEIEIGDGPLTIILMLESYWWVGGVGLKRQLWSFFEL